MGFLSSVFDIGSTVAGIFTGSSPWASAASAALGFLGSERANEANSAMSAEQMRFQKYMSDTAHQREVKDLKKAGLNPMLSARYGGASTPAGSMAVMQNSGEAASRSMNDSMSRQLVQAQIRTQDAQANLASAEAEKVRAETPGVTAGSGLKVIEHDLARYFHDKGMDRWLRERLMQADGGEAIVRHLEANIDYNTAEELDREARRRGFGSWEAMVKDKEFRLGMADLSLRELEIPKARALADFYKTPFGREVAPYLNSGESLVRMGAGLSGIARRSGIGLKAPRVRRR